MNVPNDDPLVRYLLGHSSEEERTDIEERLFADDAFEVEFYAAADDVTDAYLTGRLNKVDRAFFESRFLAVARHRERASFLKHLRTTLAPAPARRAWMGWAAAAGLAAALLGGLAVWSSRPEVEPQVAHVDTPPPPVRVVTPAPKAPDVVRPRVAAAPTPPAPVRETPAAAEPGPEVHAVRLARHDGGAAIDVPLDRGTRRIHFEIEVDADTPSFDAVLRAADGSEVWRESGLAPPAGDPLAIDVPADLLKLQRYALVIEGEARRGQAPRVRRFTLNIVRRP